MRTSRQILNTMMHVNGLSFDVAKSLYATLTPQQRYNMTHGLPVDIFQPLQMQMIRAIKEAAEFDRLGVEAIKLHGTLSQKMAERVTQLLDVTTRLKACADLWAKKQGFRGRAPGYEETAEEQAREDEADGRLFLSKLKPQPHGISADLRRAAGERTEEAPVIKTSGLDGEWFGRKLFPKKKPLFTIDQEKTTVDGY